METRQRHSLPWIRFTTLACLAVIFDAISCISLWIAGGTSKYLERSVEDFSLITSTFDLACLAAIRGVSLITFFFLLERVVLKDAVTNAVRVNRGKASNRILLHVLIMLTAFACLCYAAAKGGLVIHRWTKARHMHPTYKALCIVATVFPLVELLIGIGSIYFMRKLYSMKVILIVNEVEDGSVTEKETKDSAFRPANLKRLLLMAQPVSCNWIFLCINKEVASSVYCTPDFVILKVKLYFWENTYWQLWLKMKVGVQNILYWSAIPSSPTSIFRYMIVARPNFYYLMIKAGTDKVVKWMH